MNPSSNDTTEAAPARALCLGCQAEIGGGKDACPECGSTHLVPLRAPLDPLLGRRLGKYEIVKRLGAGAFGNVYLATHQQLGHRVAVKVLKLEAHNDPDAIKRFYAEARNTSRLQHPNNIRVHDFGHTEDGFAYIVMEFVDGVPLDAAVRPMAPARVARLGVQIASALREAHERGLVHRDLKPENMILTRIDDEDFIKVLDYGISKLSGASTGLTGTGLALGTPAYMAPEQLVSAPVDHRADIYALGLILYELIAGQPPHKADNPIGYIHQRRFVDPPRLARRAKLSRELEQVVLQCLEREPEQRPQSMAAVRAALLAVPELSDGSQSASGQVAAVGANPRAARSMPGDSDTDPLAATRAVAVAPATSPAPKSGITRPPDPSRATVPARRAEQVAEAREREAHGTREAAPRPRSRRATVVAVSALAICLALAFGYARQRSTPAADATDSYPATEALGAPAPLPPPADGSATGPHTEEALATTDAEDEPEVDRRAASAAQALAAVTATATVASASAVASAVDAESGRRRTSARTPSPSPRRDRRDDRDDRDDSARADAEREAPQPGPHQTPTPAWPATSREPGSEAPPEPDPHQQLRELLRDR